MKKFLAGCAVSLALIVAIVAALMVWAFKAGSQQQNAFYAAVYADSPDALLAMMDPALRTEVDAPVIAQWMAAMKANLGPIKGLKAADFSTNRRFENGKTVEESKGTVRFEKGDASSELVLVDGKLVKFNVESERLANWFTELSDTALYREQGQKCLELMFTGQGAEAHAMMHPNLQTNLPLESLVSTLNDLMPKVGALKQVTCASESFTPGDTPELSLVYDIVCESGLLKGTIDFQFVGMKGHLVGVDIAANPTPAAEAPPA